MTNGAKKEFEYKEAPLPTGRVSQWLSNWKICSKLLETPKSRYVALTAGEIEALGRQKARATKEALALGAETGALGLLYLVFHNFSDISPNLAAGLGAVFIAENVRYHYFAAKDQNRAARYLLERGERPVGNVTKILDYPVSPERISARDRQSVSVGKAEALVPAS
ncbi:MAG: hypothetical protein PHE27_00250 [Alphaproteobacteria bacterium]|nr:hypothetical protein [Alphaproteobacteria bacterium]